MILVTVVAGVLGDWIRLSLSLENQPMDWIDRCATGLAGFGATSCYDRVESTGECLWPLL
ncbi:MAG TPA: hypothetical protein V6D46_03695 [Coleofasciculaceae cyanobacterium]